MICYSAGLPGWLPANSGDVRNADSMPGLGRSLGRGHGNPLQYSCQDNPMDRGSWWATVHGVAESDMTEVTEHDSKKRDHMPFI